MKLIKPKEIKVNNKKYIISKFNAFGGREILRKYSVNKEADKTLLYELMKFVAVKLDNGVEIVLENEDLANNHVENWVTLTILEKELMDYNQDPLDEGRLLASLRDSALDSQVKNI